MRILFLDIDGVLNSTEWLMANHQNIKGTDEMIDPEAVKTLNSFTERLDVKLVISSTWRLLRQVTDLRELLNKRHGLTAPIIGKTPRSNSGYRGGEIDTFLKDFPKNKLESFVIVDDDSDMKPHMDRLVKTSNAFGLKAEHLVLMEEILKKPYARP